MGQATTNDASTGQRAAIIAGLLGLIPALGLGALRFSGQESSQVREQLAGNLVFALIVAAPYLLALIIARTHNPVPRGSLLLALGLLSLPASFIGVSGVTLLLLPATIALFVAAVRSLWGAGSSILRVPLYLLPGLLGAGLIGFSFYALFQVQADEPRCWVLVQVEGREKWQPRPVPPQTESGGTMLGGTLGPDGRRGLCTSDIITDREAAFGLAGVGAGLLVLISTSYLGAARRPVREQ